ncbi:MAG: DUF2855 family protein [Cellvibrionaceae bacterium]
MKKIEFLVNKNNITEHEIVESSIDIDALNDGQVMFSIDHFAFTANNITYAAMGDKLRYWDFFPASDNKGCIPVWGFAEVTASRCHDIEKGDRFYGYFPMATHLIVEPSQVRKSSFVDGASHRSELAFVYNQYLRCSEDPLYREDNEPLQMLFRPLFTTSFLIDDFLADNNFFGASQIILTSASSKTAISLAYLLQHAKTSREQSVDIIGLTSKGKVDFVNSLGYYDQTLDYDALDSLGANEAGNKTSVIVDFAGNTQLIENLHRRLAEQLKYTCMVGLSHWEENLNLPKDLPGPKPIMFFAPSQSQKRMKEWGGKKFQSLLEQQWSSFSKSASQWVEIETSFGPKATEVIFEKILRGEADPKTGQQVSLFISE